MLKNSIAYAEICGMSANICEFLDMRHMWHNFCICDFENAIICGKICEKYNEIYMKYKIYKKYKNI